MDFSNIINYAESDWLDFKREWYKDTTDMILDILCMANSDAESERYIVIGYDESTKQFCPLAENRRNRDDVFNILNTANFNRIPNIHLETVNINENELDIIVIERTKYRPYFLLKDKCPQKCKKCIRAGVIYSRTGSSNTPINECASENDVANMWRERFGLTLSPKERFNIYIQDIDNWKHIYNDDAEKNVNIWYYEPFPEFTMEYIMPENMISYSNPPEHASYNFAHSIGNSYETSLKFKYHTTIIDIQTLIIGDNVKYYILHPHIDYVYYNPKDVMDVHVFANNNLISDRGASIKDIDAHAYNRTGVYNQVRFCYNFFYSFTYCVQKILNKFYDINKDYRYFDDSQLENGENFGIVCPSQIYLLEENEDVATRLRSEFIQLQKREPS